MRKFVLVVLLVALCGALPLLAAPIPAITVTDLTGETLGNPPFTLGWQFSTSQSINVTGLGVFDDSQDGLTVSHDVGIWDSLGNLMGMTTVSAGTVDPLVNQFRYSSVSFSLARWDVRHRGVVGGFQRQYRFCRLREWLRDCTGDHVCAKQFRSR